MANKLSSKSFHNWWWGSNTTTTTNNNKIKKKDGRKYYKSECNIENFMIETFFLLHRNINVLTLFMGMG